MGFRGKILLAGLAAALVLAASVGSASATRLSLTKGELIRAIWTNLQFVGLGRVQSDCRVTLEGSFHSATIAKVERALIGHITRASVSTGSCTAGNATVLTETLPWHVQYGGFNETLPTPRPKLRLIGASFRTTAELIGSCLTRTTATEPAIGIVEPVYSGGVGSVRTLRAEEGARINCGGISGEFRGTASVTEHSGAANVSIQLI